MTDSNDRTLRLVMPQWQGGNLPAYYFGSQLLAWLAPEANGPVATVEIDPPATAELTVENGIIARSALLRQLASAETLIAKHTPGRIVILGGDCLVDLAPFAYLNEKYLGDLAVLWVDAHPDILTPAQYTSAHAMVLGNLLGEGDIDFAKHVRKPIKGSRVMYAGLFDMMPFERAFLGTHDIAVATPTELAFSSEVVLNWLRSTGARNLAIHLDLDVLDPHLFRSLYFSNPKDAPGKFGSIPQGRMTTDEVVRLLNDVAQITNVVGLGITEHLPWDAIALRDMLGRLPLLGNVQ
jgi:arginase